MATRTVLQEQTGETAAGGEGSDRVRPAGHSPGGASAGDDRRLRLRAPTPVGRGRHGDYPGNAGNAGKRAGPAPAPQDVGPLGGRPLAGVQQRLWGGQHALVRRVGGAQLAGLRLVLVDDHDVLGHLFELVDQPLAFHLGEDSALVVVPVGGGGGGVRGGATALGKQKCAHPQPAHLRARPIVS